MAPLWEGIVAVYPTEFQAPVAYEAVDSPVFLGLDPMLLALLVAIGALLFFLGWLLRNSQASRTPDAAERIWKAIDEALKAAMKADGGSLVGRAEEVERTIQRKLGATLALCKGLCSGMNALKTALEGRRPGSPDDHHGTEADHDEAEHGDDAGDHAESPPSGAVTQITVVNGVREAGGAGRGHSGSRHTGSSHTGGGHSTHLTPRERDHAIRAAIADLNDHWRHKSDRIGEMQAAHRELSAD